VNAPRLIPIVVVAAVIATVCVLDVFLARAESTEVRKEAQGYYRKGAELLASGRPAEAVEALQRAYTLERRNPQYQLAYAEALIGGGHHEAAAALLDDFVRRSPNDGKANLLLARLARARNDFFNEAAYYHRAIYGVWDRDAAVHSNEARLEWIRELVARGDRKRLLGELLPLEAETRDFGVLREVAHYLLVAGSPIRAAELYRMLLETHPGDAGLHKELGQAETATGEYAAARRTYLHAFRMNPGDASIRHEMQLVSALSAIDPTPRRLPSREKYGRSVRILRLVRDSAAGCGSQSAELIEAERMVNLKHADTSNEAAEQVLQLAESLWRNRPVSCAAPEVLPMLMQKLAQ
jgi:cytochrome c-type biogenesis protein CcmH/NrfG